ncbi:MAG: SPOR domain-containing protein [Alphaproteobacteria bacterium]|nr:SPOR domain-containing protein [Alphaproteobacteria bacterium]
MSRPTGPVRHPGMPAPPEFQADPHAAATDYEQPAHGQTQQPYQAQPHQQPPAQAQAPDPQQYAQGYAPSYQEQTAPGYASQQPSAAPTTPGFEQNAQQFNDPAAGAAWPQGHTNPNAYMQQPAAPQANTYAEPSYDPTSTPVQGNAAYHQAPHQHVHPTTPTAAPSGYDFSSYDAPQPAAAPDPVGVARQEPHVDWGHTNTFAPTSGANVAGGAAADLGFAAPPGSDPAHQPVHVDEAYAGDDEDYEYEDEDDVGRRGGVLVVAALAGAILIGGGVAYGYQTLFGAPSTGMPPVVKGAGGPLKVKPADPGGRKFAHRDSKIMGRLGSAAGNTNDPSSGARRVSTLRIGRDGSIVPPASPAATGATAPRMVSGLTLGDTPKTPAAAAAPTDTASINKPLVVKPPAATPAAKTTPVKIAKVAPVAPKIAKPKATAPKPPTANVAPQPTAKKVAVAKPAPVATGPKPTGAGYVAVLASVPVSKSSRMDALKQFADMQQKYTQALQNKTPDVQQANLGAKGTYHRLIAGPPGSAQSARTVCDSLKSAGYGDCWVLAY